MFEDNKFQWRPNDFSSKTNLRYDLEAEHWLKAFDSAKSKSSRSMSKDIGDIGILFTFIFLIIGLIITSIIDFIKWIVGLIQKNKRERKYKIRREAQRKEKELYDKLTWEYDNVDPDELTRRFRATGPPKTIFDYYGEKFDPKKYNKNRK